MKLTQGPVAVVTLAMVFVSACGSSRETSDAGAAGAGGVGGSQASGGAGGEPATDAGAGGNAGGGAGAGGNAGAGGGPSGALAAATVLDLDDVKTNPTPYAWFDFKPNVKKLILAGAPETQHVAILWYTTQDGGVGLHYHAKTESVYVIDGTQTDGKGTYPTGTVYFNPPGSGHQVTGSTGFFLLAYAAPPDFMSTGLIQDYTPVRLDTTAADLTTAQAFQDTGREGVRAFSPPLDDSGGLSATFLDIAASGTYVYTGNYLLVLRGSCAIEGLTLAPKRLVVGNGIIPQAYTIAAPAGAGCLALGVSFS